MSNVSIQMSVNGEAVWVGGTVINTIPGANYGVDILPNVDHRENITNMDEVKGACLIYYPPYNCCTLAKRKEHFQEWGREKRYHYLIDPTYNADTDKQDEPDLSKAISVNDKKANANSTTSPKAEEDNSIGIKGGFEKEENRLLQVSSLEDNNKVTYISRALFDSKPQKHNIMIACFIPTSIELDELKLSFEQVERNIINAVSKILWANGLEAKNLWREFDLNRIPSPALYLDRDKWKDLLTQIDKQVSWRNSKFGKVVTTYEKYIATIENITISGSIIDNVYIDHNVISGGSFNSGGGSSSGFGSSSSNGSGWELNTDNAAAKEIFNILVSKGFSTASACGILGNIEVESTFNPSAVNSSGGYTGLCQLNGTRLEGMKAYAASTGQQWNTIKPQIEWIICEMEGSNGASGYEIQMFEKYCGGVSTFKSLTDPKKAAEVFDKAYERSSGSTLEKRKEKAQAWYDKLKQVTSGGGSHAGNYTVNDNAVVNGKSNPTGFIEALAPAAIAAYIDFGVLPSVTLAQAIEESGWGGSSVSKYCKNLFGIKYTGRYAPGINVTQGSNCPSGEQGGARPYNKYESYADSVYDHGWFLANNSRYKTALSKTTAKEQLQGIAAAGYAENPNYANNLMKIVDGRDLTKYDNRANTPQSITLNKEDIQRIMTPRIPETNTLVWPCPEYTKIGSGFGMRLHPIKKVMKHHDGVDLPAPGGTPILAAASGTVTVNSYQAGGAGYYITIDHGNGLGTRYMHMQEKSSFAVGSTVIAGQQIGKVGTTGGSTGNHLHFEVHENFPAGGTKGTPKDPMDYTEPGNTSSTLPSTPNNSNTNTTPTTSTINNSTGGSVTVDQLVSSLVGNIINPGAGNDSMGGINHDDWGGKTSYYISVPTNINAKKPDIISVTTNLEYDLFCEKYFLSEEYDAEGNMSLQPNFNRYWELIDVYAADNEPYDKGLVDSINAEITTNDRLNSMTYGFTTANDNIFKYNVIESGPGSVEHCVKSADELNMIAVPTDLKVEPIYPDLIIPPSFSTTDYDVSSPNSVPLNLIEATSNDNSEYYTKQVAFDYDLLKDKSKITNPCAGPLNFDDPYPTDDKIQELESHYPKIFIDEIESQLYSDNHPGSPIAQPIAKNFAMIQDAMMNQSKKIEKRITKLENILSTFMRNQSRLGARMNINCVYYGGQYPGNKYKCIRCLHDNRIHDDLVTIDQCLNCTRYEPILGQVYQILDDTGLNGSIILDDMQMSYSTLEDYKKINTITERSPKYRYVEAGQDKNCFKPKKNRIEIWKEANKKAYEERHANDEQDINDIEETNNITTADRYTFKMDWSETFFNTQEPDVKPYPAEGIKARYKKESVELNYDDIIAGLDQQLDADTIMDLRREQLIANSTWVDTREIADTVQVNKYSSENFYFDGFAGIKNTNLFNTATSSSSISPTVGSGNTPVFDSGGFATDCRNKIVEMAKQIVADCQAGKAWYSRSPRTIDYTKPQKSGGKVMYDCTSFVSCCYTHAGLKSMYNKTASGGTMLKEALNGGQMWMLNAEGIKKAKPGDVIMRATQSLTEANMGKFTSTSHAMIYIGNGRACHASSSSKGILETDITTSYYNSNKNFFIRPADLIAADNASANKDVEASSVSVDTEVSDNKNTKSITDTIKFIRTAENIGTIDNMNYVAKIPNAVVSTYNSKQSTGASGLGLEMHKTCAAHNIPYGTKIYIPALKDILGDGILTVTDTGTPTFDFSIYTNKNLGKSNLDVYVIEWGSGAVGESFTESINKLVKNDRWFYYVPLWTQYKNMGGQLITFYLFNKEDINIKNHPRYKDR